MIDGFRNPVIPGFNPDPSVVRVGDTYWCVTSSFCYFPGVPLYRSHDLVEWEHVGNILDRVSQLDLSGTGWISQGIYAPTIRHHDGVFHMITTMVSQDGLVNFVVTATDPLGPWSEPVVIPIVGIDPDIAWDADGNCWVHHSIMQIMRARIDPRTGVVVEEPRPTWNGTGLHCPEAPHLFEIDGTWYLLIAEGGTERGHCVSIARGPSPTGPWESCPHNPIISHRSTTKQILNTGHADLVQAPDGSWWMMLLGVRPKGATPAFHVLGRETFLVPFEWRDGWPVVGDLDIDMPVRPQGSALAVEPFRRDDFDRSHLHPGWLTVRRPAATFSDLDSRPGSLVLRAETSDDPACSLDTLMPAFVARRQEHHGFEATAAVEVIDPGPSSEAGLALYMDVDAHYRIALEADRLVARVRMKGIDAVIGEAPRPAGEVVLAVRTSEQRSGPDVVHLGHLVDGSFVEVGSLDGRFLSTEVCTGFVGRTVGMYASHCTAAFDWFCYTPLDW